MVFLAFGIDALVVEVRAMVDEVGFGGQTAMPNDDSMERPTAHDGCLFAAAPSDALVALAEESVGLASDDGGLAEGFAGTGCHAGSKNAFDDCGFSASPARKYSAEVSNEGWPNVHLARCIHVRLLEVARPLGRAHPGVQRVRPDYGYRQIQPP
jgi:hypothetical protein